MLWQRWFASASTWPKRRPISLPKRIRAALDCLSAERFLRRRLTHCFSPVACRVLCPEASGRFSNIKESGSMKLIVLGLLGITAIGLSAAEGKPELKDQKDKVSYSIGMDIGRNIKRQQLDVNVEALAAGIKDVMAGGTTSLTEEQAREVMTAYRTEMQAKQQTQAKEAAEKNKKEGAVFLAENKKKEGVKTHTVTLPQGGTAELQYKVLVQGTGAKPS